MTLGELKELVDDLLVAVDPAATVVLWPAGAWDHAATCEIPTGRGHDCGKLAWSEFDTDDCTPTKAEVVVEDGPNPPFVVLEFDRVAEESS